MRFALLVLAANALTLSGSTIFGAFTTTYPGTTYVVSVVSSATRGADLAGMVVTAKYASGETLSCVWTSAGVCDSGADGFSVSYPATLSVFPQVSNNNWTITNNRQGGTITSVAFNGITALIAFDRCMTGPGTFDDRNPGGTTGTSCTTEGTPGSSIGFSVGSGTAGTGTTGITGIALYTDQLRLAGQSPVGDWWGQFGILFGGTAFTTGSTFTFRSDADVLASAIADVPEPATFGLAGLALITLGGLQRRRK